MQRSPENIPIKVQAPSATARGGNRTFVRNFTIGRDDRCDVQVDSTRVSRIHTRIVFEEGRWWVVDDGSTNGTYLNGERIDRAPLAAEAELQLGETGPVLRLIVPDTPAAADPSPTARSNGAATRAERTEGGSASDPPSTPTPNGSPPAGGSVTRYVQRYFNDDDRPAGAHTQMLRQAYQRVQQRDRRRYVWGLAAVGVLCLVFAGYAVMQHLQNERLAQAAEEVFLGMKEQTTLITQLKRRIEQSGNAPLQEQLAALEAQREKQQARYAGYVEELGLYRKLSAEEREIYQVARIFGESEFSIPAGFVREVRQTINNFWKGPARTDLVASIHRAERLGYTPFIVRTMQEHGLPPELFYLALQESRFNPEAVGPETRWGIAKGMWQFIPSTAQRYGLQTGPRADTRAVDPMDERHDVEKSTRAAARYLQTIYSTTAQASGLLVVASYNWGEHRIISKMERLPGPQGIPSEALQGIPEDPDERNYWRFLREYRDRMPEETKDYVLKIFSAAVIGHNPQVFGFDFENPLQKYMEAPVPSQAAAVPDNRDTDTSSS